MLGLPFVVDAPASDDIHVPPLLNGTITPNGLHFVVARTGFPDIDPDKHRLVPCSDRGAALQLWPIF
jgi:hypothetical protein